MNILHITPTYFDDASVIGGGERYPTELAGWMSRRADTTLVSYSQVRKSQVVDALNVEVYPVKKFIQDNKVNAFNWQTLRLLPQADVVHIHNLNTLGSVVNGFVASLLQKPIFVTDYGGGSGIGDLLNCKFNMSRRYHRAIAYSRFGAQQLPPDLQTKVEVIKGGIDSDRFCPDPELPKQNEILYVGRILPHKGINDLVEGFRKLKQPDYRLKIMGRVYHQQFYQDLLKLAEGLPVDFIHDADDQQLLYAYRTAKITVLPSVHTTCYGDYTPVPELMGFTLLESQACGTPAICTDAGAMSEFVDHERTGLVVAQNSPDTMATALREIINLSSTEYQIWQEHCRTWIEPMSWRSVTAQHLQLYQTAETS
jgi:glycosyltransferase involved in cell wall biosynthesis